jgi:hypothetical protein
MSGAGALERRYRRLLVFYPARYRRVHEDEMLAVLMTAAPEGKRRPGIAEAADLVLGALRIRLQPQRDAAAEPAWRDALAVLCVILPVLFLLIYTVRLTRSFLSMPVTGSPMWVLEALAAPLALVAVVLLRLRRAAALAAVALLIWASVSVLGLLDAIYAAPLFLALGLEIAALTASPGPRRGLQILTRRHRLLVLIAALAVSFPISRAGLVIVMAVIGAGMALSSSLGRWLLLLLAIPAYPFFVGPWEPFHLGSAPGLLLTQAYLPPLVLLVLAVTAARRQFLRSS